MARIRTIKPEFFTSADIVGLTPLARLFYVSMWCEADREGRLNWNTDTFKFRYFPADNCNILALADEVIEAGLVILYEVNGKQYAEIPSFKTHQVINNRESESIIPSRVKVASARVPGEGRKEGREGKEGKEETHVASKLPTCPHQEIIQLYHEILPACPRIREWTDARQKLLARRWREKPERQSLDFWRKFFEYVADTPFLVGQTPGRGGSPPWFADLEWLVRPQNFVKVIEGKYEDRQSA